MKALVLLLGLAAFSLSTAPAFAGGCMEGTHTHPTDSGTKTRRPAHRSFLKAIYKETRLQVGGGLLSGRCQIDRPAPTIA